MNKLLDSLEAALHARTALAAAVEAFGGPDHPAIRAARSAAQSHEALFQHALDTYINQRIFIAASHTR